MLINSITRLFRWEKKHQIFIILLGVLICCFFVISFVCKNHQNLSLLRKINFHNHNINVSSINNYYSETVNQFIPELKLNWIYQTLKFEKIRNCINPASDQYAENKLRETTVIKNVVDTTQSYKEYEDICTLIVEIWNKYPNNEVQGYITNNGKMIVTSVGDTWQVTGPKPILFNDQYYLAWDKREKLIATYQGAIEYSGSRHIFIPIKAMFHTHVVSGTLSQEDQLVAKKYDKMRHLLFERNRISEYNVHGIKKIYKGNMINLCQLLQSN